MKDSIRNRILVPLAALALAAFAGVANAQASRLTGTVTAIDGSTLTVKTAQGDEHKVEVPSAAELKRIEPGQTKLSDAAAMQFSELAAGDRVLVWLDPNAATQALRVVAIKAADIQKKQDAETEDWRQRGLGGLVKSVDPASGAIVIAHGTGPTAKTVTIHTTGATVLKRYAPASVDYTQAKPASIDAIHAGDQLMARGDKNADGTELTAEEVVSGGFRNVSGVIASVDPARASFTLKDLSTKKMVTVQVSTDTHMHQISPQVAQALAARLKGAAPGTGNAGSAPQRGAWQQRGGAGGGDPQQMLARMPVIQFSELQKGQAVMLVSTQGDEQVTAITLLEGVEALLEAPASQDLFANWSMNSSAETGEQ